MSAPFCLLAPIELSAKADGANPRFSGTAYSGGLILDYGPLPVVIDLASTEVGPGVPLLYQHRDDAVIGAVTEALSAAEIKVSGDFFSDIDPTAGQIAAKAQRGAKYQMSVGLYGARYKQIDDGEQVSVNGIEHTGPVTVLQGGRVREVSIVSVGADAKTEAQFLAQLRPSGAKEDNGMAENAEISALKAKIDDLDARLKDTEQRESDATKRADEAEATLKAERMAARKAAVDALAAATGCKFTDEEKEVFARMEAQGFETFAKHLRETREPDLFSSKLEDAKADKPAVPVVSTSDIYAARRVA